MDNTIERASKRKKSLDVSERAEIRDQIIYKLLQNEMSLGQALKYLRLNMLGIKQQSYADFVKVSRKTLSDLENDKGNYSIDIINQVLRPFELQVGIVPVKRELIRQVLTQQAADLD